MKHKTIVLIILGFLILASLCSCENHVTEGLNTMKNGTHVLHRGEYMDDTGNLESEDGSYGLILRYGSLQCWRKDNGTWRQNWNMNASGSKIMLLNNNGTLQFKSSKNDEYIPITESHGANSLVLTAYGTLELKSETGGNGETLWTYPVAEGFTSDAADNELNDLMNEVEGDRSVLTQHAIKLINANITNPPAEGAGSTLHDDLVEQQAWAAFKTHIRYDAYTAPDAPDAYTKENISTDTTNMDEDIITGEHDTLLENARKLDRLRNTLDNKVKDLHSLGDSHITDKQMHIDSTIFITLAWTALASSLVYYTFTY